MNEQVVDARIERVRKIIRMNAINHLGYAIQTRPVSPINPDINIFSKQIDYKARERARRAYEEAREL